MSQNDLKKIKLPLIAGIIVFLLVLLLTQYLAYQQYLINKKREHETLLHELNNVKDKFRNILYNNISAANALVIIYKEYGYAPENFDAIARQIIKNSKYVEAIQLTKGGIITNVYPLKGYEKTIGINSLKDKIRQQEAQKSLRKDLIFFAGPRKLRQGGIGILGKVPIVINDEIKGYCVVLTKLETVKKALKHPGQENDNFAYSLTKNPKKEDQTTYILSETTPSAKSEIVTTEIPEGDWILTVSYSQNFKSITTPYYAIIFGILVSALAALLTYRKAKERHMLKKNVEQKTYLLHERIKELSTVYKINNILIDENQSTDEMFCKIIELIPSGWQFTEICEAKITFNNKEYKTKGYSESEFKQKAYINLGNQNKGTIEVVYIKPKRAKRKNLFLEEEQELINSIAQMIEIYLNKKAQKEALNQSEERFRVAFEMASIGTALVSLEGNWLKVNIAICEMMGYTEKELLNLKFQDITHPDDLKEDTESLSLLLSGKKDTYRVEKRYIHKNGSIIWGNLNVAIIKNNGKPAYFVSQIENITERVESQNKFKDLVEKSLVGIFILKDNKISYVNPEILEETGYQENELIGQNIQNIIHEEDLPIVNKKIQERLNGRKSELRYEIRIKKKDGAIIWNEMFTVSTYYQGGQAIIGTMVDITTKKNMELERQKIITDLTQRNQDLEQFSYIVSHNIRGPVANLLGLSDILESDFEIKDLDFIHKSIKKSALALDNVINEVNAILNIRKDFLQSKTEIDLYKKVKKIKYELNNSISLSQAKISCDFSVVNVIYSIAPYIHSIFLNLISNSLKYTAAGKAPEIKIWSEKQDSHIKIYFQDHGTGIDLEKYGTQIFGLYKRFHSEKEGKGLGLFMVKTQVNALQGTVEVKSENGRGALFIVTLPV